MSDTGQAPSVGRELLSSKQSDGAQSRSAARFGTLQPNLALEKGNATVSRTKLRSTNWVHERSRISGNAASEFTPEALAHCLE